MDWDALYRVMRRAVERGLARREGRPSPHIGIDEKSFGRRHSHGSVVSDLSGACVLEVVQNRDEEAAGEALQALPEVLRQSVAAVAMDMWKPFVSAVGKELPQADIVFGKFHLVRVLNTTVDAVHKQEHRHLQAQGEKTLSGSKYLWLKSPAKRSKPEPIKSAADTLKRHLAGILTYFKHRITNASAEGLNSLIQSLRSAARGFRNFANYRIAILFNLGKLDLKPITTHTFA